MNIRTKKLMSLFLAVSMVFSMNTLAFGGTKKAVNISSQGQAKGTIASPIGENTKVTFTESKTAKGKVKPKNVATIEHTDNPLSWNSSEGGQHLMETVLSGYETSDSDNYLNNSQTLSVNTSTGGFYWGPPDGAWMYSTCDLGEGIVLLVRWGFGGPDELGNNYVELAHVEGADEYIPGSNGEFKKIPVRAYDGRSIAFNKSGLYKATKSKVEILDVVAAVVKYDNGTVTELDGTQVASVKFSSKDGAKVASVSGETIEVKKPWSEGESKDDDNTEQEYKKIASALPTFTVKVKGKGDAKAYVQKMNDAFSKNPFTFAIRQMVVRAYNIYEGEAYAAKLNKETLYQDGKELISPTNSNTSEYLTKYIASDYGDNPFYGDSRASRTTPARLDYDSSYPLFLQKFKGASSKVSLRVWTGSTKNDYPKASYITLKSGTDYKIGTGKLADTDVFYLDLLNTGNIIYSMIGNYTNCEGRSSRRFELDYDYNYEDGSEYIIKEFEGALWAKGDWRGKDEKGKDVYHVTNLAPFGFKIAFRQSPKNKKLVRTGGVFKEDNVGFVYSED